MKCIFSLFFSICLPHADAACADVGGARVILSSGESTRTII